MARLKEFDPDEALEKAMQQFWRSGYDGTSMADLINCMGINRGSLYDTFGDKEELFKKAFEHYVNSRVTGLRGELKSSKSVVICFRNLLQKVGTMNQGCMVTNSAAELCTKNSVVHKIIRDCMGESEEQFYQRIREGQAAGEISKDKSARDLAIYFVSTVQGMMITNKVFHSTSRNNKVVRLALKVLS